MTAYSVEIALVVIKLCLIIALHNLPNIQKKPLSCLREETIVRVTVPFFFSKYFRTFSVFFFGISEAMKQPEDLVVCGSAAGPKPNSAQTIKGICESVCT